jgi:pyruvate formate lyase activating enzyme
MDTRREFLARLGLLAAAGGCAALAPPLWRSLARASSSGLAPDPLAELVRSAPRARFWEPAASSPGAVHCLLCAHGCVIPPGERGRCRARMNVEGELRSLVYGRPLAVHVDPIEKKPFYHFLPGSTAFSLGTAGCPLRCKFCQNWTLSQAKPEDAAAQRVSPGQVANAAAANKSPVIAFTYNEPTVQAEFLLDTAREARKTGIRSAIVSCGFMNEEPLREMCGALAAVKIDLKGFSPDFYRKVCGAELAPVLRSIKQAAKSGVHLEIVNLVVPTLNDSERMLGELAGWMLGEAGPDVPLHFTRFHPDYQLQNLPPTPVATLEKAREIAMGVGMRYVYVGNVPGHPGNHTICPKCGKTVIERSDMFVTRMDLVKGKCLFCGRAIAGVWA